MSDFHFLGLCTPAFLFRVHSASSQGSNSSSGFQAASLPPPSLPPFEHYQERLSTHLNWNRLPSPWISTTSSLLWALAYARWKTILGEQDVQISLLASADINPTTLFPSGYLVRMYAPQNTGKPWHDSPQGEFLVWGQIPGSAVRGTVAWKDLARSAYQLMPALSPDVDDRPHQRVSALRKIEFTSGDAGMDHEVPITKQDCIAALVMANLFRDKAARFSLFAMGLAFRARSLESLNILALVLSHRFKGKVEEELPCIFPSSLVLWGILSTYDFGTRDTDHRGPPLETSATPNKWYNSEVADLWKSDVDAYPIPLSRLAAEYEDLPELMECARVAEALKQLWPIRKSNLWDDAVSRMR